MTGITRILSMAVFLGVALTGAARADATLAAAVPAQDGVLKTKPVELELRFSEAVDVKSTSVKLSGPQEDLIATADPSIKPNDPNTLIVPITGKLAAGKYRVEWRAQTTGGGQSTGAYSFSLAP